MSTVLRASGDAASVASTRQNPDELEDFNIVDIDALQQHGINVADIKVLILPTRWNLERLSEFSLNLE